MFGDVATLLSDFTGPDETPLSEGGNWANLNTVHGDALARTSNQCRNTVTSTAESYWTPATFGPDVEAYVTIPTLPTNTNSVDISVRVKGAGGNNTYDSYRARAVISTGTNNDFIVIGRIDDSVLTDLDFVQTFDWVAGEKLGIRVLGSLIEGWRYTGGAWELAVSATDTTYALAGNVALHIRGTVARADDYYVGTVLHSDVGGVSPHFGGRGAA